MTAREWLFLNISPRVMIITGLLIIPSFLFQDSVLLKAVQTVLFVFLSVIEGKRFKPLPPLIMVASITLVNLFNPFGRIIFIVGTFRITFGALYLGLIKGLTLVGLIYLSRSSVRSDLNLPGRLGRIIGRTFYYFDRINERWAATKGEKRSLIGRLDTLLLDIDARSETGGSGSRGTESSVQGTTPHGYAAAAGFLILNWVLFALKYLPALGNGVR